MVAAALDVGSFANNHAPGAHPDLALDVTGRCNLQLPPDRELSRECSGHSDLLALEVAANSALLTDHHLTLARDGAVDFAVDDDLVTTVDVSLEEEVF